MVSGWGGQALKWLGPSWLQSALGLRTLGGHPMGHSRAGALHPDCVAFGKLLNLAAPPCETEEHTH